MWSDEKRLAHRLGKCVHFRGIQHDTCAAGVSLESVKDLSVKPYRWACTGSFGALAPEDRPPCALRVFPTQADLDEADAETARLMAALCAGVCGCHGEALIERGNFRYCPVTREMLAHIHPGRA